MSKTSEAAGFTCKTLALTAVLGAAAGALAQNTPQDSTEAHPGQQTPQARAGGMQADASRNGKAADVSRDGEPAQASRERKTVQSDYDGDDIDEDVREAWLEGKLEAAFLLNRHLNNFTIDSEVDGSHAELEGEVESEIDSDLAEQVALSVDGIDTVDNELRVVPPRADGDDDSDDRNEADDRDRSFSERIEDATLTAETKMKLLANDQTHGLEINVDTFRNRVTLTGDVSSAAEKDLAEKIAGNVDGVSAVNNKLQVNE